MYKPQVDSPSKPSTDKENWCDYLTCNFRRLHCPRKEVDTAHRPVAKRLKYDLGKGKENPRRPVLHKLEF